ncbi:MAG: HlyC/CorC family transporter [Clostridia bacterium]|nr:HlyC/CorC family transporter [Clostridia bacterium]
MLLQLFLILVNAFFAACEISMVSLNVNKLKKEAEEGDKRAARMLKLVEQPTSFLSAIQIGITLAGFLGSAFAADNFSERLVRWLVDDLNFTAIPEQTLDTLAVVAITLILSFFTLVLGELVPKRIGMHFPIQVAKFTTPVVRVVAIVLKPVIWLLSVSTAGVLLLFGVKDKKEEEQVTEDDIRLMADVGEKTGAIDAKEREMIDNIFELGKSAAKDVMTRAGEVVSINVDANENDIIAAMADCGFSRIPVWEEHESNIIGILIVKEYLINLRAEQPRPLRDILRAPYFVPETVSCDALFSEMQSSQKHMAIVIDEYGDTAGIVTMEDLIEEILGNIYDESDDAVAEESVIVALDDGTWRIAGHAELDDVCDKLELELPEDIEANTFGGLVIGQLNEIPEDGTSFEVECYGLHIMVDVFAERRVESAIVRKIKLDESVGQE